MGPTPRSAQVLLLLVWLAGPASAQPPKGPAGQLTAGVAVDDLGRASLDLSADIQLDEHFRLSGFLARSEDGATATLGYGQLELGDLRLGGGALDHDWGLHLGYAPRIRWRPHPSFELRAQVDAAIGGGGLGSDRILDAEGRLPDTLDLYAGALGARLEAALRPWRPLLLRVGLSGDLLAVGAPPRGDQGPVETLLGDAARFTDLGLSSALSQAAAGAYGQADLRLLGHGANGLTLSYREAWDWIHLDPLQPLLRATDAGAVLRLESIPPRATRSLALQWRQRFAPGFALRAGVEGRHVRNSTTALDFADRDGWSVGAWVGGEAGPLRAEVQARYHFQAADLEPFLGDWPRYQVAGQLSARVAGNRSAGLRIETGAQVTLTDALGLPQDGFAVFAQLRVWFGGPQPRRRSIIEDGALPHLRRRTVAFAHRITPVEEATRSALPGTRAEATALAQSRELREPLEAFLADIPASERAAIVADGRALLADGGGLNAETGTRLLDRQPQLAERIDRFFPGLLDVAGLGRGRSPNPGALVTGYGRAGLSVGAVTRVSRYAITERTDRVASDLGVTTRAADLLKAGPTSLPSPHGRASLSAFVQSRRVDAYTVLVPRGRRYRVLAQVRSRWARFMQRALTGRR